MRYFTSYLKKVIWLHNSCYLLCVTPNTASVTNLNIMMVLLSESDVTYGQVW